MNIVLNPPESIVIPWQDYVAGNFDLSLIPWKRSRYSGDGVVEVPTEAARNGIIAKRLARSIEVFVSDPDYQIFTDIAGIEIPHYIRTKHEERIPDLMVVPEELADQLDIDRNVVITLDMTPPPLLIAEVVSPSSTQDDIEVKANEYEACGITDYLAIHWQEGVVYRWSRLLRRWAYEVYSGDQRIELVSLPKLKVTVNDLILVERSPKRCKM